MGAAYELATGKRRSPDAVPGLVDEDLSVATAFGLAYTLPEYSSELYKNVFSNDLSLVNASGT